MSELFDDWPEPYERWFQTPIGVVVKAVELDLVLKLLDPRAAEHILDAGCGSGIFTTPIVDRGSRITGLDLSLPMLERARSRLPDQSFVAADMSALPFTDAAFDKVVSVTALEFIENGKQAFAELFRVARPGGIIVVATLNSLSPWATRREEVARTDRDSVFRHARFRSPEELAGLTSVAGETYTAVHFARDCDPGLALEIERQNQAKASNTGAFLIGRWKKP